MKHVLHFSTWHPCIDGVSGKFVLEQCAALQNHGIQTGLVFSRIQGLSAFSPARASAGLPGFVESDDPVPTVGFKSWNLPGGRRFVSQFNRYMLKRLFRAYSARYGKPDVLHAHVGLESGSAVRELAINENLQYLVTEHSSQILRGNLSVEDRELANQVYSSAKAVIAVSAPLAERILEFSPNANVRVVGNMVREAVFDLYRPHFDLERSRILMVTISSLVPEKRVRNALFALSRLPDTIRNNIAYHVIGDGPERSSLELLAKELKLDATFYGNLAHDTAMRRLAEADLLVHPSAFETFGVVIAEAMAVGVPVVATRSGGPEFLVTNDTGRLVAVDDVDGLSSAIMSVVSTLIDWRKRSLDISAYARSHYHESVILNSILREYGK